MDGSTMTVPTIPAQELPTWYAWTLQKYVNVPAVLEVCLNVAPGVISTGGGPGGLKFALESQMRAGPVIVWGSVGFASLHWTIVPWTTVMFSGAKACTAYTESPQPAVAWTVTVETPVTTTSVPVIPG